MIEFVVDGIVDRIGIGASRTTGLSIRTVSRLGKVASGLPGFGFPIRSL